MPLTKTGKEVLSNMKEEYGKEKGKEVFYKSMNANPEKTKDWHMTKPESKKK